MKQQVAVLYERPFASGHPFVARQCCLRVRTQYTHRSWCAHSKRIERAHTQLKAHATYPEIRCPLGEFDNVVTGKELRHPVALPPDSRAAHR